MPQTRSQPAGTEASARRRRPSAAIAVGGQELDYGGFDTVADASVHELRTLEGAVADILGNSDSSVVAVDHARVDVGRAAHRWRVAEIVRDGLHGSPDCALVR